MNRYKIYYNPEDDSLLEFDTRYDILYFEHPIFECMMGKLVEEHELTEYILIL